MITTILTFAQRTKKWKLFLIMLLIIGIIGTLISLITLVMFQDNIATRPRIAVIVPLKSKMGTEFKQGVELYLDTINLHAQRNGYRLTELLVIDETANATKQVLADKRVVAVVGYFNAELLKQAAANYEKNHIPVISPLFMPKPLPGVTTLGLNPKEQARFVANYARNIQQQRLMYVIREENPEFDSLVEPFLEVYNRFETPVKQVWTLPTGLGASEKLKQIMADVKNIDIGGIYIAANPELAAQIVKGIRETGNALEIYGSSQLGTHLFSQTAVLQTPKNSLVLTHGIIASTPILFDTANEQAQHFQSHYQKKFAQSPDWIASYAYEAAHIALSAHAGTTQVKGILGSINFENYHAQIPIQMGVYNGDRFISAPVQLLPIAKSANFNYIEALRQGRVLYVNDRFMFKTNVVYIGIAMNEILDLDLQKETALLDLSIWFRYRGNFSPQDILIENALEPVKLEKPVEKEETEEVQYRRYHVKQTFKLNFTDAKRAYGQHIAGISLRHRQLNRNNLMYVVDVLGMPSGNALIDDLHQHKAISSNMGWVIDNAWVSQDIIPENGEGAPRYIGMTGEQPIFSKITLGLLLKPATAARDIIPDEYFIYIAIFGVLGSVFAGMLDFRRWGRFWSLQSWLLRAIFWPLALLSVGNLTLDWAFIHFTPANTRLLVIIYESLWWIMLAELLNLSIRRFIWEPMAQYAQNAVPNIIKLFVTAMIFSIAFSGILVMVFNQSPTSLMATSGILAMVVGMAVKDIIANVFSGIILNFERPFRVGDKVKVNSVKGIVKDITWRSTKIESDEGHMVSISNGKIIEAFMENYSQIANGVLDEIHIYTSPDINPAQVIPIIKQTLNCFAAEVSSYKPKVNYHGIVNLDGNWVADFVGRYRITSASSDKKLEVRNHIFLAVREELLKQNISLNPIILADSKEESIVEA